MGEASDQDTQLDAVVNTLVSAGPSPKLTVRAFLGWFGAQRRGSSIVGSIRNSLEKHGLRTIPDFESAWIDGPLTFALAETLPPTQDSEEDGQVTNPGAEARSEPEPAEFASATGAAPQAEIGPSYAAKRGAVASAIAGEREPGPELGSLGGGEQDTTDARNHEATSQEERATDPSHRISKLEAANHPPERVTPDSSLIEAVTIMLTNGYSQVPVMTSEREVKGIVTWESISSKLALGFEARTVRDAMTRAVEIRSDASIFDAIPTLVDSGYVLVSGPDGRIVGIVTSSDLSLQFRALAEPFLLLGEIENRIRNIIAKRFPLTDLQNARDPAAEDRPVAAVDDLTIGEYIRLLEEPSRWAKADLRVDRTTFIDSLHRIRGIRNEVMHFDTDSIPDEELVTLRNFARFLQRLEALGAV